MNPKYMDELLADAMVRYMRHMGRSVHYEMLAEVFDVGVLTVVKLLTPRSDVLFTSFMTEKYFGCTSTYERPKWIKEAETQIY